jgi:hypothetical protein
MPNRSDWGRWGTYSPDFSLRVNGVGSPIEIATTNYELGRAVLSVGPELPDRGRRRRWACLLSERMQSPSLARGASKLICIIAHVNLGKRRGRVSNVPKKSSKKPGFFAFSTFRTARNRKKMRFKSENGKWRRKSHRKRRNAQRPITFQPNCSRESPVFFRSSSECNSMIPNETVSESESSS